MPPKTGALPLRAPSFQSPIPPSRSVCKTSHCFPTESGQRGSPPPPRAHPPCRQLQHGAGRPQRCATKGNRGGGLDRRPTSQKYNGGAKADFLNIFFCVCFPSSARKARQQISPPPKQITSHVQWWVHTHTLCPQATPAKGSGPEVPSHVRPAHAMVSPGTRRKKAVTAPPTRAPSGVGGRGRGHAREEAVVVVHGVQHMLKVHDQAPGGLQCRRGGGRAAAGRGANSLGCRWQPCTGSNLGKGCQRLLLCRLCGGDGGAGRLRVRGRHWLQIDPSIQELDGRGGRDVGRAEGWRGGGTRWRRTSSRNSDSSIPGSAGHGLPLGGVCMQPANHGGTAALHDDHHAKGGPFSSGSCRGGFGVLHLWGG